MAQRLAAHPVLARETLDAADWEQLAALLDALGAAESGVLALTVEENGTVVFQGRPRTDPEPEAIHDPGDIHYVRIGLRRVGTENGMEKALSFSRRVPLPSGGERRIELALRRDADGRHHQALGAVEGFYRLSLIVFLATVGACLVLVLGVLRFDRLRQDQGRRQEQLALAGAIAGGILHDFRNPLSALHLDAQLLRKELQKGAAADLARAGDLARRLQEVLERLDTLLGEAVVLARPEAEGAGPEPVDVRRALLDSLALVRPRFERAGLILASDLPESPARAWGRPGLLTRAFLNLLINAEQHSPQGGTVSVRLRTEAGRIVVEVADQGPGIVRQDRRRVFDMYFSRRPGGTGLGLSLARAAVEDCGGTLRLGDSGAGARFILTLPAMAEPAGAAGRKGVPCPPR